MKQWLEESGESGNNEEASGDLTIRWMEELRESQELLQLTINSSLDRIHVMEAVRNDGGEIVDFRWLLMNEAATQKYGNNVGKHILDLHPGVKQEGIFDAFVQVTETGVSLHYEKHYQHEGLDVWVAQSVVKLKDGIINRTKDITERKKAELALKESKELLQSISDVSLNSIACYKTVRDSDNRIIDFEYVYQNTVNRRNHSGESLVGRRVSELNPGIREADIFERFIRTVEENNSQDFETGYNKDGREGWYRVVSVKLGDGLVTLTEDITARKNAEWELLRLKDEIAQKTEEKYRLLFNSIDQAFCMIELIYDESGKAVDLFYLEANPMFEKQIGHKPVGRKVSEMLGEVEPYWFETYDRIFKKGEPERFESRLGKTEGWYTVYVSPMDGPGSKRAVIVFDDITDRKVRELQQAFLSEITNDLLGLTDIAKTMDRLGVKLGHFFGVKWAVFSERNEDEESTIVYGWNDEEVPSLKGYHRIKDYFSDEEIVRNDAGEVSIVKDTKNEWTEKSASFEALGIRSFISVPLARNGRWKFQLSVVDSKPRHWTFQEIELIKELANRIWIRLERARAEEELRRFALLSDESEQFSGICDLNLNPTHLNRSGMHLLGIESLQQVRHLSMLDFFYQEDQLRIRDEFIPAVFNNGKGDLEIRLRNSRTERATWVILSVVLLRNEVGNPIALGLVSRDITKRKKAEEALKESEERFRNLVESYAQAVWETNAEGAVEVESPSWSKYTGQPFDEGRGFGFINAVHPDEREHVLQQWKEAVAARRKVNAEFRLRCASDGYRWTNVRATPIFDKQGNIRKWTGMNIDVHDRRMIEDALRESEAHFRTVTSLVPALLWQTDAKDRTITWNPRWLEYTGQTFDESQKGGWINAIHPEDREATSAAFARAFQDERPVEIEHRIRRNDGQYRWFLVQHMPVRDVHGNLTQWFGAAVDIHEQHEATDTLRVAEERYRIALQSADLAAWDWNMAEDKIQWNDQHFLLLGLQPEDRTLDLNFFMQFVYPEDLPSLERELKLAIEGDGVYRMEAYRMVRADNGQVRWMSGYGRVVGWQDGRASRMVGVLYDITERKTAEQQKEEFLGIASHELRTPVTSIKIYTEMLQERFEEDGDAEGSSMMQKLNLQVDRLTKLIRDLLDTTKLSEGKLPLHPELFDLNELIQERVEDMQRISQKHELQLQAGLLKPVSADRERIGQVLTNLLSNAIKYSPKGGPVRIRTDECDTGVCIAIQDQGIGIPENLLDKVFDRFFRVVNLRMQTYPGMGLGLYISAGIVQRHGGTISVSSVEGEGSTFTVFLPHSGSIEANT